MKRKPLTISLNRAVDSADAKDKISVSISMAWIPGTLTPEQEKAVWTGVAGLCNAVMSKAELRKFLRMLSKKRQELAP